MIEKHISSLLYRYQCVIVPDFGAFLSETRSAHFDEKSKTFFPPQKTISFNANIKHNDGLLANHISLITNKSYDNVLDDLSKQVDLWNQDLAKENSLVLDNIGEFCLNIEHNLEFTPFSSTNYLATSFGLSPVLSKSIQRSTERSDDTPRVIALPKRKRTSHKVMRYAAVIAVCAGLGSLILENEFNSRIEQETLSIEKKVQDQVQDQIQKATFFIDTPVSPITLTIKEKTEVNHPYHIVAGAFKSEENAQKAIAQLKSKGFVNATYLKKNKHGLFPVLYGSYADMNKAQQVMKGIHKKVNSDAWILIQ